MSLKKGPLIAAVGAVLVFAASWPLWAQSVDIDFRQLIYAAKANAEKIESGRGTAHATNVSYTPDGRPAEKGLNFRAPFAFDGAKARYDHVFGEDRPNSDRKFIVDGPRSITSGPIVSGHKGIGVFIEPSRNVDGRVFAGWQVDPRRTMEPFNWDFDTTLRQLDLFEPVWKGDEPLWTVSVEEDGQYKVVLKFVMIETDEATGEKTASSRDDCSFVYWFDPEQGFALTRDLVVSKGVTTWDTEREYRDDDGTWVITSVKHSHRIPSTNQLNSTSAVEYVDFEANVDIPESRFTIPDFGFPPWTTVYDRILGLEYTLAPEEALRSTAGLMASLLERGPSADEPSDEPNAEAVVSQPEPDVAQSEGEIEKPASVKGFQLSTHVVVAILAGAVAFLLLAVAIYKGKRRSA